MNNSTLKKMNLAALFAALTAVFSQIAVPLPFTPVPINLATLAVMLSGGLLGARCGFVSQAIYVCLGLFGLPVFAQFTGGPGIVLGPTGGYIAGYLPAAGLCGILICRLSGASGSVCAADGSAVRTAARAAAAACAFAGGLLACYIPGTLWFMASTGNGLAASLVYCVIPFLPGEALKIAASVFLTRRLLPVISTL